MQRSDRTQMIHGPSIAFDGDVNIIFGRGPTETETDGALRQRVIPAERTQDVGRLATG